MPGWAECLKNNNNHRSWFDAGLDRLVSALLNHSGFGYFKVDVHKRNVFRFVYITRTRKLMINVLLYHLNNIWISNYAFD